MRLSCTKYGILLFDGDCAFCIGWIRFILKWEHGAFLRFAARNSESGMELCRQHGINPDDLDSLILIREAEVLTHSDAVLAVSSYLRFPWSLATALQVIPRWLRDGVYTLISRNRLRLSTRNESCELLRNEWKDRFLG
jgi:predicted DCC family thiol-disulfide oxidoreductase YuxK